MTESLTDFVDSCILQELSTKFVLNFTDDKMFANVVYYSDCRSILRRNGYTLREHGTAFTITKGDEFRATFDLGLFSANFVNSWVADSGIKGVQGFPVGFNKSDAKGKQGGLSRMSVKFMEEIAFKEVTPAQADCDALSIFNSDEVVKVEGGFSGLYIVPVEVCSKDDFIAQDQTIVFTDTPDTPFYVAINMKWRQAVVANIPDDWLAALKAQGLSYNYDSIKGILYVGNTKSASYGFPPSARHLKLVGLELEIEDWESSPANNAAPAPPSNNTEGAEAANIPAPASPGMASGTAWNALVQQFLRAPSAFTYASLVKSESALEAFSEMNKGAMYKMGTNKNKQTSIIRQAMLGEGKKRTYPEYAKLVEEVAYPKGDDYFLVLIFRMRGLIRQADDKGAVYFSAQ
jgi:hypothetical protein